VGALVTREEVRAAVETYRELGPAYEDAVVDSLVEKIEQSLAEREPPPDSDHGLAFVVTLVSLGVSIPMLAIASGSLAAIAVVCAALVLVNAIAWTRG
jgi:hypothetical protein